MAIRARIHAPVSGRSAHRQWGVNDPGATSERHPPRDAGVVHAPSLTLDDVPRAQRRGKDRRAVRRRVAAASAHCKGASLTGVSTWVARSLTDAARGDEADEWGRGGDAAISPSSAPVVSRFSTATKRERCRY